MCNEKINVALVGNPNVGKTSLYNRLTHSFEHVGNWHGVTVSASEKNAVNSGNIVVADLPGLYSLTAITGEEALSRDYIYQNKDAIIVCVCDACNLERNLYLALQLLEFGAKIILAINMIDDAEKEGIFIDEKSIEESLGCKVIKICAKKKESVDTVLTAAKNYKENYAEKVKKLPYLDDSTILTAEKLINQKDSDLQLNKKYSTIKILENDEYIIEKLKLSFAEKTAIKKLNYDLSEIAALRYSFIEKIMTASIKYSPKKNSNKKSAFVNFLDRMSLSNIFALPIFLLIMFGIFYLTFGSLGKLLSELLKSFFNNIVYKNVLSGLNYLDVPDWISGLITEGIILSITGVLQFIPQISIMFFCLTFLEDSGYLSRIAFLTDGFFRKLGLSGRSVFTMIMGFGCTATAVLSARALEDDLVRRKTVLLTPFMSCSAKLPVYTIIVGAYFSFSPIIIFLLYFSGIMVALLLACIFEKITKFKSGNETFIMEMPSYRFPSIKRLFQILLNNIAVFLIRIGTVIFSLNIIIWILANFSFVSGFSSNSDDTILAFIGKIICPVFYPLGFGNWRAVTSLLSGIIAKEAIMTSIEGLGGIALVFGTNNPLLSALPFLVFILFYPPCIAAISATIKESGIKWALFGILIQTLIAYFAALLVRILILLYLINSGVFLGVLIVSVLIMGSLIILIKSKKNGMNISCGYCKHKCGKCNKRS